MMPSISYLILVSSISYAYLLPIYMAIQYSKGILFFVYVT